MFLSISYTEISILGLHILLPGFLCFYLYPNSLKAQLKWSEGVSLYYFLLRFEDYI
jgi:hypothetical protein